MAFRKVVKRNTGSRRGGGAPCFVGIEKDGRMRVRLSSEVCEKHQLRIRDTIEVWIDPDLVALALKAGSDGYSLMPSGEKKETGSLNTGRLIFSIDADALDSLKRLAGAHDFPLVTDDGTLVLDMTTKLSDD